MNFEKRNEQDSLIGIIKVFNIIIFLLFLALMLWNFQFNYALSDEIKILKMNNHELTFLINQIINSTTLQTLVNIN
jgi:hypothetical protein